MDRFDYYFKQAVAASEVNEGFAAAETAIWRTLKDQNLYGIVTGFRGFAAGSFLIGTTAGTAIDKNGARLFSGGTITADIRTDTLGVSTLPSAGHRRWVSVYARFGRNLSDPRTDGLGVAVKFNQAEALNPDDVQADVGKLLLVQGTEALTSSALPARHAFDAAAILLADVLLTDGDTSLLDAKIDTARAERVANTSQWSLPPDTQFSGGTARYVLVSSMLQDGVLSTYSRIYASTRGLCITSNAFWDPVAATWNSDSSGQAAIKTVFHDGIFLNRRAVTTTPWDDSTSPSTGWDGSIALVCPSAGGSLRLSTDTEILSTGEQTVAWGIEAELTSTGGGLTHGAMCPYPKSFFFPPSSVTVSVLGSDAGSGTFTTNVRDSFANGCFIALTGTVPTVVRAYRTIVATA